ncbi:bifunctional 2',3'-cyclic-nucleotide 2'-phosphodiesterase/3'-nucleotidase [Acetobacter conturbans]|uniref:Bifunctional 2',3'-cyclic-nucleotide 2'-phosphodiesterase/3'-nucleotidase n=1 Tax=Acetobacter conturbans TaxID=1737472 RepID=A0ABX0JVT9_9PROT|nr:bifunctional 2',3'-cyclic-nucleotide 2'-phosphodiesterase/3'-nucleotidase [Acetobacter conturbans]NHN87341.1 bifunctional 2',3'-cyclic-nucleotide 2'-phosphodiesterase/3'-nucleotidase [Acetobacter conturbans]
MERPETDSEQKTREAGACVSLRLLETSDLHMFLRGWDYYRAQEDPSLGLSRVASLIRRARAEVPNCLLFDNGDACQGSPMGDFMAARQEAVTSDGAAHPMIRAMNLLRYDATTLGNHEFNYGLSFLGDILKDADFPVLCSNLKLKDGSSLLPESVVMEREMLDDRGHPHTLRIGVVGFLPPQVMVWDAVHVADRLVVTDMVDAAREILPTLRKRCDVLIALCHCGISAVPRQGGDENAALYLAELPEIDALLLGHTHHVFPGPGHADLPGVDCKAGTLHGKPAVMPGFWGSHLGVIDLTLRQGAEGWSCERFHTEVRPVCRREGGKVEPLVSDDEAVAAAVQPEHEATIAWMNEPVGETTASLSNWFTFLGPDPCLSLVNAAQLAYAHKLLAHTEWAHLPLLSAASPFHVGCAASDMFVNIPAGPLTMRDLASIYPFANILSIVRCSGAELREWLERAVTIFNRIVPECAEPQKLLDPASPVYTFDVVMGDTVSGLLTYDVDITRPRRYADCGTLIDSSAHRISNLHLDGQPVDDEQVFAVVTNNYRASGGGHFPGTGAGHVLLTAPKRNRDILVDYVRGQGGITPDAAPGWRFAPCMGTATVCIDLPETAVEMAAHRPELTRLGPADGGGFRYAVGLGQTSH